MSKSTHIKSILYIFPLKRVVSDKMETSKFVRVAKDKDKKHIYSYELAVPLKVPLGYILKLSNKPELEIIPVFEIKQEKNKYEIITTLNENNTNYWYSANKFFRKGKGDNAYKIDSIYQVTKSIFKNSPSPRHKPNITHLFSHKQSGGGRDGEKELNVNLVNEHFIVNHYGTIKAPIFTITVTFTKNKVEITNNKYNDVDVVIYDQRPNYNINIIKSDDNNDNNYINYINIANKLATYYDFTIIVEPKSDPESNNNGILLQAISIDTKILPKDLSEIILFAEKLNNLLSLPNKKINDNNFWDYSIFNLHLQNILIKFFFKISRKVYKYRIDLNKLGAAINQKIYIEDIETYTNNSDNSESTYSDTQKKKITNQSASLLRLIIEKFKNTKNPNIFKLYHKMFNEILEVIAEIMVDYLHIPSNMPEEIYDEIQIIQKELVDIITQFKLFTEIISRHPP